MLWATCQAEDELCHYCWEREGRSWLNKEGFAGLCASACDSQNFRDKRLEASRSDRGILTKPAGLFGGEWKWREWMDE